MWLLAFLLVASFSFSTFATCMISCSDSDEGAFPKQAGVVTLTTSCAPPGGPVHTSTQTYSDKCENNILDEMTCEKDFLKQVRFECFECSPAEGGVCLKPGTIQTARP